MVTLKCQHNLIFLFVVLNLVSCSPEPKLVPITRVVIQISQVEVTKVVEITREVNVTRIVENVIIATHTITPGPTPPNMPTPTATATTAAAVAAVVEEAADQIPTPPCILAPPYDWASHTIEEGDTLFKYSTQNETTISRIQQVNCLSGTLIREGSTLWLPITPTPTPSQTPTPLPSQPLSGPPPDSSSDSSQPPRPNATPTGEQVHTIQADQNLFRIGLQYGCTVEELSAYNGIVNSYYIDVGQQIRIPPTCGG